MARADAAIVLAAGHGSRMGGPKVRLTLGGESLLAQHVARLGEVARVLLVVVRPELAAEARALCPACVHWVESRAATQAGSLACAVRALGPETEHLFVTPVDLLPAARATYEALGHALGAGARAATPTYRGRGGHPVLLRRALFSAGWLAAPEPPSLRTLLHAAGDQRLRVEVEDPRVRRDFDTRAEAQRAGLSLRSP